jgi:hypothetical protein
MNLTEPQKAMMAWHIKNGSYIGIGKPLGGGPDMPAVRRGKGPLCVIDRAGYEQFASKWSVRCE